HSFDILPMPFFVWFAALTGGCFAQNSDRDLLQTLEQAFLKAEEHKNREVVSTAADIPEALSAFSAQTAIFLNHYGIFPDPDDDRRLFENAARRWGVRYRWGGTSAAGMDCQGLARVLMDSTYGLTLPAGADAQYRMCTPVRDKKLLRPGDLVFFKIGGATISHVGVYLKNRKFIHATTCCGVIVSDLDEPYYRLWYFSGGRPPIAQAARPPEPTVCPPEIVPFVPEDEIDSPPAIEACHDRVPLGYSLLLPFVQR
ncbi:MAG: C40 family peptidase, partial [Bacteroidia bacterium]|nr:C40 family peptidase [Bacteroidia bacterium]